MRFLSACSRGPMIKERRLLEVADEELVSGLACVAATGKSKKAGVMTVRGWSAGGLLLNFPPMGRCR